MNLRLYPHHRTDFVQEEEEAEVIVPKTEERYERPPEAIIPTNEDGVCSKDSIINS